MKRKTFGSICCCQADGIEPTAVGKKQYMPARVSIVSLDGNCCFLALSLIDTNEVNVVDYEDGFSGAEESEYTINF